MFVVVSAVLLLLLSCRAVNNVFFLKNNAWGKRFLQAWKHFTLHAENKESKNGGSKTCGFYDQCPFGVAMLQVAQDYHWWRLEQKHQQRYQQQSRLSSLEKEVGCKKWLQSRSYNATLENLAFRSGNNIQNTLFQDELGRLVGMHSGSGSSSMSSASLRVRQWKDANVPLQIGPILLVPTWEGGLRFPLPLSSSMLTLSNSYSPVSSSVATTPQPQQQQNNTTTTIENYYSIPSSLTIEPTSLFFGQTYNQSQGVDPASNWPFAIHAKYSNMFCGNEDAKKKFRFEIKNRVIHETQCSSEERTSMWNNSASCWAIWNT